MRILHLITSLAMGGTETQLATLAPALRDRGHEVHVASILPGGYNAERLRAAGIPVTSLSAHRGMPVCLSLWSFVHLVREFEPSVIQSWLYHADLLSLMATRAIKRPMLVWNLRCSTLDPSDHSRLLFPIIRLLARSSRLPAAVVTNSLAGKAFHTEVGYRPRQWAVIFNALDTELFCPVDSARVLLRRQLELPLEVPLVGLVARFHPMKDHATFLRAATQVQKERPEVHFVLVGSGIDEKNTTLRDLIRAERLEGSVHLLGGRGNMHLLQAAWDVAVCSSYSEGFPNVLIEAMSCGVPCVSTDVGDTRFIIDDTGEIVPPRRAEALASGILRLLDLTPAERRARGERARQRVIDHFSLSIAVDRYLALYQNLASENA